MKADPKPDPSENEVDPAAPVLRIVQPGEMITAATPADSEQDNYFTHGGKRYQLYKRSDNRNAPYYVKFEYSKKLHKKCTETNNRAAAIQHAKTFIDKVRGAKWEDKEKLLARSEAATLGKICELYPTLAIISQNAMDNNVWAMGKILRVTLGVTAPETVSLNDINAGLVDRFQSAMVKRYCAEAEPGEDYQRIARDKALRSSKSMINQARSLFNKDKDLVRKYTEAGLKVPLCVVGSESVPGFMNCKVLGKIDKGEYLAPADGVVEKAFLEIEKLATADPNVYVAFWLACGAGLRRKEIRRAQWEHWIERDGRSWISGGLGKDGKKIEVPVQARAVKALAQLRQANPKGPVIAGETGLEWAKRLNFWMKMQGWNTEKKMHELRAYVGSLIYQEDANAAMRFMRHKTIRMTEQFYVRYGKTGNVPDVL